MAGRKSTRGKAKGSRFDERPQASFVPPVGLSETLLEFAKPVLMAFDEPPADELLDRVMMIVTTIWNAHAMALPVWGEPEHLSALRDTVYQSESPQELIETFELLSARRQERYRNDPRVVSDYRVTLGESGFQLACDPKLPRRSIPPV